jgi:hypothetical protein
MKRFHLSVIQPGASRLAYDFSGAKAAISAFRLMARVGRCEIPHLSAMEHWARVATIGDQFTRSTSDMFSTIIMTRIR